MATRGDTAEHRSSPTPDALRLPLVRLPSKPRRLRFSAIANLRAAIAAAQEQRRLVVLAPFAVIAGLISYTLMRFEPDLGVVGALTLLTAVLWIAQMLLGRPFALSLLAFAFCLGLALLPLHGVARGTPMMQGAVFGTYRATIDEVLSRDEAEQRVVLTDLIPLEGAREPGVRRVRLLVRGAGQLSAGDVIEGPMRIAAVPGPVLPGGFDSQFHAYFDGIGAFGNTTRPPEIVARQTTGPTLAGWLDGVRFLIGQRIDAVLEGDIRGIARALIIGDQTQIDPASRDVMSAAGVAHVLAISGLHLSLVAGGVFWALRLGLSLSYGLGQRLPVKKLAALAGIAAGVFYLGISGASVSATRATIMLTLIFGAVLAERRALTMRNVALAALVILVIDPASVFRASFQLSFAAVVALVGFYEGLRRRDHAAVSPLFRIWRFVSGLALTSLVAGAATLLFTIYHFQQTAPLGVLGNVLALPLVGFVILPAGALAVAVMPLGLEGWLLATMGWGVDQVLTIARVVAGLSTPIDAAPLLTPVALQVGIAALAWFAYLPGRLRWAGPLLAIPMVMLLALDRRPDILVADLTQAVAIRTSDGLALISGRRASFAPDVWSESYGEPVLEGHASFGCDEIGCIAAGEEGALIAVVRHAAAFAEDCRVAVLVITRLTAPGWCRAETQVIDAGDLRRHGGHRLDWNAASHRYDVRPAIPDPLRPWRPGARRDTSD